MRLLNQSFLPLSDLFFFVSATNSRQWEALRALVVCLSVLTPASRGRREGISMELATKIWHVSGRCWKGFQGWRSRSQQGHMGFLAREYLSTYDRLLFVRWSRTERHLDIKADLFASVGWSVINFWSVSPWDTVRFRGDLSTSAAVYGIYVAVWKLLPRLQYEQIWQRFGSSEYIIVIFKKSCYRALLVCLRRIVDEMFTNH